VLLVDEMQLKSRIEFDRGLRHCDRLLAMYHQRRCQLMLQLELTWSLLYNEGIMQKPGMLGLGLGLGLGGPGLGLDS